ncbi:hypothetical protein RB195_023727 [Necator americanus]
MYGSQAWAPPSTVIKRLDCTERKLLRRLLGYFWPRVCHNEDLYAENVPSKIATEKTYWTEMVKEDVRVLGVDRQFRDSAEAASDESGRLMENDDDGNIQIAVPTGSTRGRMGRRFTLNPIIFAKEEREARRQSLAQLKLSYYPKHMNPESYDAGLGFCGWIFMFISWLCVFVSFPVSICFCIKV